MVDRVQEKADLREIKRTLLQGNGEQSDRNDCYTPAQHDLETATAYEDLSTQGFEA